MNDALPEQLGEMTLLLQQLDDPQAQEEVLTRSFLKLRSLAQRIVRQHGQGLTIAPSDVVQEYYLRLSKENHQHFTSTDDFLRWSWMKMKNVLWDHARKKHAEKRGGRAPHLDINDVLADVHHNGMGTADVAPEELLLIEQLLKKLQDKSQKDSDLVDLYYFGGFSQADIGKRMNMSDLAVKDRLRLIRAWLKKEARVTDVKRQPIL